MSADRRPTRPGLRQLDPRDVAAAKRRDRYRRQGCRRRRGVLSEIEAFSAVTPSAAPATQRPSLPFPIIVRNQVLLVLAIIAAVAALTSGFVVLAPNRLISGRPIALWSAVGSGWTIGFAVLGALLLAASLSPPARALHVGAALMGGLLLLLS